MAYESYDLGPLFNWTKKKKSLPRQENSLSKKAISLYRDNNFLGYRYPNQSDIHVYRTIFKLF
jgi:hypothetical protein